MCGYKLRATYMCYFYYSNKVHTSLSYKGSLLTPAEVFYPGVAGRLRQQQPPLAEEDRTCVVETTDDPPVFSG